MTVSVFIESTADTQVRMARVIERWKLTHCQQSRFKLTIEHDRLRLYDLNRQGFGAVEVDWVGGSVGHRRRFGGGKNQAIAKSVGLKGNNKPSILDATAGLGRDSFILAALGCHVHMMERNPVIAALLEDGLRRASQDDEIGGWVRQRLSLSFSDSISLAKNNSQRTDVIYLDPMFPSRQKTAQVKKEMQIFASLVGPDQDADELLEPAMAQAKKRVVVKRPSYAPPLANVNPTLSINTKKNRFDVYVIAAIN